MTGNRQLSELSALSGGFLSVLLQTILLREALFGQRMAELSTGLVIAGWLIGSGIGAALSSRLRAPRLAWVLGMVSLPMFTVVGVVLLRGEGIYPPLAVLPAGLAAGIVFVQPFSSRSPGRIYASEALGAALGGGLYIVLSPSMLTSGLIAVSFLASAVGLASTSIGAGLGMLAPAAAAILLGVPGDLEEMIQELSFPGFSNVESMASPFGEISALTLDGERSVYVGGVLSSSSMAPEAVEQRLVVPLTVSGAEDILYLGSDGLAAAVMGWWPGVQRVIAVSPDASVLELAIDSLPPSVTVLEGDGRAFMNHSTMEFDLIVSGHGMPLSLSTNRFYTSEFFELARKRLAEGGILSFSFHAGRNRILPAEARLLGSIRTAAGETFESVEVLPLGGALFMTSMKPGIPASGDTISQMLRDIGIRTFYVNPGLLPFDLSEERISAMSAQLAEADAGSNSDLRPEAVYHAMDVWSIRLGEEIEYPLPSWGVALACFLLCAGGAMLLRKPALGLAAGFIGFGEIAAEIAVILIVQATVGYSYALIGGITGILMIGLSLGSWLHWRKSFQRLWIIQLWGASAVAMIGLLALAYRSAAIGAAVLTGGSLLALGFLGMAAGIQFPLATGISGRERRVGAGFLELSDLGGSAAGGVALPLVLFPLLGAAGSLFVCAALVAAPIPFLVRSRRGTA